ncbi:MAG: hypothetical protein PHS98_04185 [Bacilli bacterium]|nr:hypothetical protein [Bacilli bacterium]
MVNRETRRREKHKDTTKNITSMGEESLPNAIKTSIIVAGVFIIFYILTIVITNNINKNVDNNYNQEVTIQYEEILASETFSMNYNDYYVLFYDFDDHLAFIYTNTLSKFKELYPNTKVYTVDLHKGINAAYMDEISNSKANKIDDLKLTGPTLIKIKGKQTVLYVEGIDAIKDALK